MQSRISAFGNKIGRVRMISSIDRHTIKTSDGVMLAVSSAGDGDAIAFVHEFSGDLRSWAPQFADFQAGYRCIAFNARGYPPSNVPASLAAYSQERAADDVAETLQALGVGKAHLVGLSMGGFAVLHTAIRHPALVASLVVAGCGYGAKPSEQDAYQVAMNREAEHAEDIGMRAYAEEMGAARYAKLLRAKDERAWELFVEQLTEHSIDGMTMTLRGVLARRPSLWHLEEQLSKMSCPVLLVVGDEDTPCIEPNLFMKGLLPDCALCVMPRTGHLPNLEEPARFNEIIGRFIASVTDGSWERIRKPFI
jgi:pimeloyl-ACP methyl ester carboxylesterase